MVSLLWQYLVPFLQGIVEENTMIKRNLKKMLSFADRYSSTIVDKGAIGLPWRVHAVMQGLNITKRLPFAVCCSC